MSDLPAAGFATGYRVSPSAGGDMNRTTLRSVLLVIIATVFIAGAGFATIKGRSEEATGRAQIQRGEYLVKIMGCNDCHTPWKMGPEGPEPDMTRFLSGHPEQIGPLPNVTAAEPFLWSGFATN